MFKRDLKACLEIRQDEYSTRRLDRMLSRMESREFSRRRRAAHVTRMSGSAERGVWARTVLDTFGGPGGASRYGSPDEAERARRLYQRAYALLWHRSPAGRASGRARDGADRAKTPRLVNSPDVTAFYKRMLLSESAECFHCSRSLAVHERVGDHFIPLAAGGEHAAGNLVVSCWPCNQSKSDTVPVEYTRRKA